MSILIVEDNPVSARLLEIILHKHGYQTITASTGKEAFEYLKNARNVRLVISDIMMPEMDGLEFLSAVKQAPDWREIPVIFLTSAADEKTVGKAIAMGCKYYIIKPIKELFLIQKVREVLESEIPVMRNKCLIMSELGIDFAEYDEITKSFLTRLSERLTHLKQQELEKENSSDVFKELLELSESASLLGGERIKKILDRLSIQEREDVKSMKSHFSLLLAELEMFQNALLGSTQKVNRL
jgi:two-component system alkaline phosphatase synthesis response regulator PhoP